MNRVSADPITKKPGATVRVDVDFTKYGLADAELLTGTPTVDGDGLTVASIAINTATFKNRKRGTVAIGKGVQFTLAGGTAGEDYNVELEATTDGSPAQTLPVRIPVYVRNA